MEWLASFQGPIGYEIRDLEFTAGGEVAFSHGRNHVTAVGPDRTRFDMWWRVTACHRGIGGTWTIINEHSSVPMDVETG